MTPLNLMLLRRSHRRHPHLPKFHKRYGMFEDRKPVYRRQHGLLSQIDDVTAANTLASARRRQRLYMHAHARHRSDA